MPLGYVLEKVDGNKKIYKKVESSQNNKPLAKKESNIKPVKKTGKSFFKKKVQPSKSSNVDYVYIEENQVPPTPEVKKQDPFAAYSKMGEILYMPGAGGHACAEMYYRTRQSNNKEESGNTNTQDENVLIRFRNDFGFTGEWIEVEKNQLGKVLGGTNHITSIDQYNKLISLASQNPNIK